MVGQCSLWLRRLLALGALLSIIPGCSDCSLSVSTSTLPNGTVGVRYFAALHSNCGGDIWEVSTGLPPGLGFQDNGDIQGVPITAGTYTFTVAVFDFSSGQTAFKSLSIEIDEPPPQATPTATPSG